MLYRSLLVLLALGAPLAAGAPIVKKSEGTPEFENTPAEGGDTDVTLTAADTQRIIEFAVYTINELGQTTCDLIGSTDEKKVKAASSFFFNASDILKSAQFVAGELAEGLEITLNSTAGDIVVSLLEDFSTGNLLMDAVEPMSFLPSCAQEYIEHEEYEAVHNHTAPANADESAEFDHENAAHTPEGGHSKGAATKAKEAKHLSQFIARRAKLAGKGKFKSYGKKKLTRKYALGDLTTPADIQKHLANKIPAHREKTFSESLPSHFNPFAGTPCLEDYTARDQGSCGSCYAFATSTALTLQACYVKSIHGADASDQPMYTVQGLVSCGLEREYTNGCEGGSGTSSFQYVIDYGLTTVGCWPYEQAGGNSLEHFDAEQGTVAECRSDCVPESSYGNMQYTSGEEGGSPSSYNTEANIAYAMKSFGALYCRFDVYDNFYGYDGGVYMGADPDVHDKSGGHAVTCIGFGTTSDGTKYWNCLNSWGGSWGLDKGSFKTLRGQEGAAGLISACTVAPIDYDDIFPAGSVPPSPPVYCADEEPSGITLGGEPASCGELTNYCGSYDFIRSACPATCEVEGCTSTPPSWDPMPPPAPTPPGTPPPPPSPSPPPPSPSPPPPSPGASAPGLCSNTCYYHDDVMCDDGGPGSEYACCSEGTDCADCGERPAPPAAPPGCDNTCYWNYDVWCDDGGPGAEYDLCDLGTDCADCGHRDAKDKKLATLAKPPPKDIVLQEIAHKKEKTKVRGERDKAFRAKQVAKKTAQTAAQKAAAEASAKVAPASKKAAAQGAMVPEKA